MSSKQLLRLFAVLGGALLLWGAVALASRRSDTNTGSERLFSEIDTSAIDTILLAAPGDTAILTRKGTAWRVNGHATDRRAMGDLLRALADTTTVAELVAENPASHQRLRVTEDSGRRVRIVRQTRTVIDLLAGKQTSDGRGVYLRRGGEPQVYAIRGDLSDLLARPAEEWRDHTIATVNTDSVSAIEIRHGPRPYSLRRKGSAWVFASGAFADSTAVAGLLSSFKDLRAAGFAADSQKASLRFGKLPRRVRLLDPKGAPVLTLAFDSTASGVWVRREEGQAGGRTGGPADDQVYRLDPWIADRLIPAESTLRKR